MNILFANLEEIALEGEIFPTESILGEPPYSVYDCITEKEIIKVSSKNQTQAFVVKQASISLYTPDKESEVIEKPNSAESLKFKKSELREPHSFDNIFDSDIKVFLLIMITSMIYRKQKSKPSL